MSRNSSIGCKRQISFWTALAFFAVAAGYVCESRLVQNKICSLSLDQENLDMLLQKNAAGDKSGILQPDDEIPDMRFTAFDDRPFGRQTS